MKHQIDESMATANGAPTCFAAGTLVHTATGLVPIEQIKVGDLVYSKPENGIGEVELKPVTKVFAHGPTQIVQLFYQRGERAESEPCERLFTTKEHPFWVIGRGWTEAWELSWWPGEEKYLSVIDGDRACSVEIKVVYRTAVSHVGWIGDSGNWTDQLGWEWDFERHSIGQENVECFEDAREGTTDEVVQKVPVYNIEVADNHTYFVGTMGVLVHNKYATDAFRIKKKSLAFLDQVLKRGVIEETPLRAMTRAAEGTKAYVVESAVKNADGQLISEGRVVSAENYAREVKGSLEVNKAGQVEPSCFMADTLVHTINGLCDIQFVGPGSWVLSRNAITGEQAYRPVLRKFEHENRQIFGVTFVSEDGRTDSLGTTAEHPFWVRDVGWVEASQLQPGQLLEICDPDWRDDEYRPEGYRQELALGGGRWSAKVLSVNKPEGVTATVYNFEVEEFHTYFVGIHGVWVHNTKLAENKAQEVKGNLKLDEAGDAFPGCLAYDTFVWTEAGRLEIQFATPGVEVLSRCEVTGEIRARAVVNHFIYEDRQIYKVALKYDDDGEEFLDLIYTTAEHPFWIAGKGWTEVRHLEIGQMLVTREGGTAHITDVTKTNRFTQVFNTEVPRWPPQTAPLMAGQTAPGRTVGC